MITTYRNRNKNIYVHENTMEKYHMTLFPFIHADKEPIKVKLNKKYLNETHKPITKKTYYKLLLFKERYHNVTYAPTISE